MNCGQRDLLSLVYRLGWHIEAGYLPMPRQWHRYSVIPFQAADIEFKLRLPGLVKRLLDNDLLRLFQLADEPLGANDKDRVTAVIGRTIE